MTQPEQYACLLVKEFPAQAILRLHPELREKPCAILTGKMEGESPSDHVYSLNRKAHALGIRHGMTRAEAGMIPTVVLLPRSREEESHAKAALLQCAESFSPRIEDLSGDRSGNGDFPLAIDISGTEKLFGPSQRLGKLLLDRTQKLGFASRIAISSGFHAAICLAHGMPRGYSVAVIPSGEESTALASLPLNAIGLTEEQAETFTSWGVRTLGMLAALPEEALIARMGQEGKRLRRLARGNLHHLFLPMDLPFHMEERMEFEAPVESSESLLFSVSSMLERLIARAQIHSLAIASVTITFSLDGRTSHSLAVRPALPTNDRQLWVRLLHLEIEAHPPGAAVLALDLSAEPGSSSKVQLGLFSPQLPEPARLDITLARIRAIVGENCAGRAVLEDTHRPDGFEMAPFRVPHGASSGPASGGLRAAMRRFRPAEEISVTLRKGRPAEFSFRRRSYAVEHAYGPWLLSGGWWKQESWDAEQWDVTARWGSGKDEGGRLCCQIERGLGSRWRMTGIYD